ncbi:hypothetical protein [Pseudarthrobacter phenanthrenivorans]|uniref:ATP/GTP-binding protein n=1 Tax=Pseudarthrobacter phenanthrenivorans TaxID=361575 RepID=A0A0B4DMY2_PSEPS|nr:hypothetical protein [Pseudarthrobacter phenanthrenivorans]KIC65745.1 ATP/GTP-binding protein [Pseudarthrobacter phenanthrenivorans]
MELNRALEQHIAVFGESGSGKTVMLSSFYGATQEPQYLQKSLFHVLPGDIGQGNRLHRNYLGMRNSARLPLPDRFAATSYSFALKFKAGSDNNALNAKSFDALRLVWHDYPGEWFEEDVSGPEEAQRRIDTFKALLGSDVALLLVDGQRLLDNAGQEERYFKSLFGNFRNGLLTLKDDLLEDGKPLVDFPRIWIIALSKSDLLPDLNVYKFRDLLIEKASDDVDELRKVIAGFVESSNALSVGEDFVLFSSAKFDTDKIEVAERVGLDLVLPLAAVLPFERHARWAEAMHLPAKLVENLLRGAGSLAAGLLGKARMPGPLGLLLNLVGPDVVQEAANMAEEKLKDINAQAMAKRDFITATLTGFKMDLVKGEDEETLLRSRR